MERNVGPEWSGTFAETTAEIRVGAPRAALLPHVTFGDPSR
jgi:hypothetical protein